MTRSVVKGSCASSCRPVAATAAAVAQTPTDGGRAAGASRVTRSAIKGKASGDASLPPTSIKARANGNGSGKDGSGTTAELKLTSRRGAFVTVS